MKSKILGLRKLWLGGLAVAVALPIAGLNGWLGHAHADADPTSYPITYAEDYDNRDPFISEDYIVWKESGESGNEERFSDLILYDRSAKTEKILVPGAIAEDAYISGNLVAWTEFDEDDDGSDIHLYDLANNQLKPVTDTPDIDEWDPVISGNIVAFRTDDDEMQIVDLSATNPEPVTIFTAAGSISPPAIYGNHIVWSDADNQYNVYLFDIDTFNNTDNTFDVPVKIGDGVEPAIYGDKVVWRKLENYQWVLYMYDLSTSPGTGEILINEDMDWDYLTVYEDNIAWIEDGEEVYLYDYQQGGEPVLVATGEDLGDLSLHEDTLVWTDQYSKNVYSNKDIGSLLAVLNNAADIEKVLDVLISDNMRREAYEEWYGVDVEALGGYLLESRPLTGFPDADAMETAIGLAIEKRTPVANVNLSQDGASIKAALEADGPDIDLDIDRSVYDTLSPAEQEAVYYSVLAAKEDRSKNRYGYADEDDIQSELDAAIAKWNSATWKYVGSQAVGGRQPALGVAKGKPFIAYMTLDWPYKPTAKSFDGTTWNPLGTGELADYGKDIRTAVDSAGTPYVAFLSGDYAEKTVVVKKLVSGEWQTVDTASLPTAAGGGDNESKFAFTFDGQDVPYVAFLEYDFNGYTETKVMKRTAVDGWVEVSSHETGNVQDYQLAFHDGKSYLGYIDTSDQPVVLTLNASNEWEAVGSNDVSDEDVYDFELAIDNGKLYAAYSETSGGQDIVVKTLNDGSWEPVGEAVAKSEWTSLSLAFRKGYPYVAYPDTDYDDKLTVRAWDGQQWSPVGEVGFTDGAVERVSLVMDGETAYLAYQKKYSPLDGSTTVMKTSWGLLGDLNGDGIVTPADALIITKYLQGKLQLTDGQIAQLDVNNSGVVDAEDSKYVLQMYLGGKK